MNPRVSIAFAATAISIAFFGCSHDLQIKNLSTYSTPLHLGTVMSKPTIAVKPFSGAEDDLFFFNALIERLSHDPGIGDVHTDYTGGARSEPAFSPT